MAVAAVPVPGGNGSAESAGMAMGKDGP